MDIRERAVSLLKKTGKNGAGASALQKVKLFCWETGLGPALNALPSVFGQQAVLYFPGRSGKYSLSCFETEGRLLMAAAPKETEKPEADVPEETEKALVEIKEMTLNG